jgi:V/A-type H+-transporting ATPase subunit B
MNAGIGPDRTVPEHREWANQLYALYARGREARLTAAIVGEASLSAGDRQAIGLADRFEIELVGQGDTRRTIGETIDIGWSLLESFPRDELTRISDAAWQRRVARGEPREEGGPGSSPTEPHGQGEADRREVDA